MQLKYGSYSFPVNATLVSVRRSVNDPADPTEETIEVDVEGELYATGQAACATAQAALLTACRRMRQNFIFYTDAGGQAISLTTLNALAGPNVTSGPNFSNAAGQGFEFVSGRSFNLTVSATYPLRVTGGNVNGIQLLTWSESIRRNPNGGKPQYGHMETMNTRAQEVQLKAFTLFKATQSGSATALLGYPTAPQCLWPGVRVGSENDEVELTSPQRPGEPFGVRWTYTRESTRPLPGLPTFGFIGV